MLLLVYLIIQRSRHLTTMNNQPKHGKNTLTFAGKSGSSLCGRGAGIGVAKCGLLPSKSAGCGGKGGGGGGAEKAGKAWEYGRGGTGGNDILLQG